MSNAHKIPSIVGCVNSVEGAGLEYCFQIGRFPSRSEQVHGDRSVDLSTSFCGKRSLSMQWFLQDPDAFSSNITSLALHHPMMQMQIQIHLHQLSKVQWSQSRSHLQNTLACCNQGLKSRICSAWFSQIYVPLYQTIQGVGETSLAPLSAPRCLEIKLFKQENYKTKDQWIVPFNRHEERMLYHSGLRRLSASPVHGWITL